MATAPDKRPVFLGPIYDHSSEYVTSGPTRDFSPGLSDEQAADAVAIARDQLPPDQASDRIEVGEVLATDRPVGKAYVKCPNLCAGVTLIDLDKGTLLSTIVDLGSRTPMDVHTATSVLGIPWEDGLRHLYGIAVADPQVAAAVGDYYSVAADVAPFTRPSGSCAADATPQHRCGVGTIFTPSSRVFVDVDLTAGKVLKWNEAQA
ncbi:MAG: hypothetical protein M3P18_26150 [Actinomycetota bacterium]|nr:hypothetical protein [Actinomycetota bacterium]